MAKKPVEKEVSEYRPMLYTRQDDLEQWYGVAQKATTIITAMAAIIAILMLNRIGIISTAS